MRSNKITRIKILNIVLVLLLSASRAVRYKEPCYEKTCLVPIVNNKDAGQPCTSTQSDQHLCCSRLIESMMVLRPRRGNLRPVLKLFSLMRGCAEHETNNLKMSPRFLLRSINTFIDFYLSHFILFFISTARYAFLALQPYGGFIDSFVYINIYQ